MNSETWKNIKIIENESISTKICGTKPRRIPAGTTSQEAINHTKLRRSPGSIYPEFIKYSPKYHLEQVNALYRR